MSLSEQLSSMAYRAGWALTKRLPAPFAQALFQFGADVASKNGRGPEQLRRNLARVVGEENVSDELVRDAMRSYMRYWREAFQLPSIAGPQLADRLDEAMTPDILRKLEAAMQQGRGAVITLPHSANWDMAGMWLVHRYGEFTTVAERLKPESLFDAFVDYRRSLGFNVIALTGSEQPPMKVMEEALRRNQVVCLLGERDLTGSGVTVEFFGERCSMPAGPALLSQRVGCPLFVATLWFEGKDGYGFALSDPIDNAQPLQQMVQTQAEYFEQGIRAHPADWHMLQPLWFKDLSAGRLQRMGVSSEEKDAG